MLKRTLVQASYFARLIPSFVPLNVFTLSVQPTKLNILTVLLEYLYLYLIYPALFQTDTAIALQSTRRIMIVLLSP